MYQSMNEFGTPYNDAEEAMRPKGIGHRHIDKQLATSGLESQIAGWVIGAVVGAVGAVVGGSKSANAARKQANLNNEATDRQYEYDVDLWEMSQEKILADRDHAAKVVEYQASNEGKLAAWKDASNAQRYNYDLMIRDREQNSLDQQFAKSNDIYDLQVTLNDITARNARDNELQKLDEIEAEARFDSEDAYIQMLQTKGKMASMGSTGRAAEKGIQTTLADYGRQIQLFNKYIQSAGRETASVIREIQLDKTSADLAAYGAKMLDPGILPDPIQPLATPMSDFLYPRDVGEFDFGPEPVRGAYTSPSAAAGMAWGAAISGIAGQAASFVAAKPWT